MIELLTWPTPNGTKPSIMLEDVGSPYSVRLVNIGPGKQHLPAFLSVSPNNKIPSVTDRDGGDALDDTPGVDRLLGGISSRLAVQRGLRTAKGAIGRGNLPS
jgi:glutathione S-transferase